MPNFATGASKLKQAQIQKLMAQGFSAERISNALEIELESVKKWIQWFKGRDMLASKKSVGDVVADLGVSKEYAELMKAVGPDGHQLTKDIKVDKPAMSSGEADARVALVSKENEELKSKLEEMGKALAALQEAGKSGKAAGKAKAGGSGGDEF